MYFDYNKHPLDLLGYIHVHIKVGQKEIKRARVVIARTGSKSIVGRDWLNQLKYKMTAEEKTSEYKHSVMQIEPQERDVDEIKNKFPDLFNRQGRIKDQQIKIELKKDFQVTQQKGRRIPI